jgi:hypothetical protein
VSVWPPVSPEPPHPLRTPWQPPPLAARPAAAPSSPGWSLIADTEPDWLSERLLERRLLALAGKLDRDAANRMVTELALLDASGDEPVTLRLSGVSADLDTALAVVDSLDLMGVKCMPRAWARSPAPRSRSWPWPTSAPPHRAPLRISVSPASPGTASPDVTAKRTQNTTSGSSVDCRSGSRRRAAVRSTQ